MSGASLGERLIVPAVVWLLVALLSGGFMYGSSGATDRMKVVFRYAMLFAGGLFYSIAWHDVLAKLFGWDGAWIAVSVGSLLRVSGYADCTSVAALNDGLVGHESGKERERCRVGNAILFSGLQQLSAGEGIQFFSLYNLATNIKDAWPDWTVLPAAKVLSLKGLNAASQAIGNTEFLSVTGGRQPRFWHRQPLRSIWEKSWRDVWRGQPSRWRRDSMSLRMPDAAQSGGKPLGR